MYKLRGSLWCKHFVCKSMCHAACQLRLNTQTSVNLYIYKGDVLKCVSTCVPNGNVPKTQRYVRVIMVPADGCKCVGECYLWFHVCQRRRGKSLFASVDCVHRLLCSTSSSNHYSLPLIPQLLRIDVHLRVGRCVLFGPDVPGIWPPSSPADLSSSRSPPSETQHPWILDHVGCRHNLLLAAGS